MLIEFRSKENTAKKFEITMENVEKELKIAKNILYEARKNRPRPHLDNKIITSWNGKLASLLKFLVILCINLLKIRLNQTLIN